MGVNATFVWAVCALLAAQAPVERPRIAPDDAALARIKAELKRPAPRLIISAPKADFRVNIDAIRPFADIFELPPWVTPPSGYDAPKTNRDPHSSVIAGVGIDPGVVAHSISNAVRTRNAHAEVIRAIVEYCAAHRDEPGAAGICGGPPR
jgi:hypothetical protein